MAFIFGSVAAGAETSASDLDVMIVGDDLSLTDVVSAIAKAQREIGREINPSVYLTGEFCRKPPKASILSRALLPARRSSWLAMPARLQDWLKFGWLKKHATSRQEIADLLAVADRDLAASKTPGLHNDWRFNISYNAALQLASAALAAAGLQAERANHHYRVIESSGLTVGADAITI